jgi:hypothetical protein
VWQPIIMEAANAYQDLQEIQMIEMVVERNYKINAKRVSNAKSLKCALIMNQQIS